MTVTRGVTRSRPGLFLFDLLLVLAGVLLAANAFAAGRVTLNFNPDWHFIKDDPAGAEAPGFDDTTWALVSAPHTYNDAASPARGNMYVVLVNAAK